MAFPSRFVAMEGIRMPELIVDQQADAAYLHVGSGFERRAVARSENLLGEENEMINLDFDSEGRLIGVELIPASRLLRPADTAIG